jgi:hypothetical protein
VGGVLCPVVCGRDDELRVLRDAFALADGGSRVECHGCGVEFTVGQGGQLDHLIEAVQQHASGSHGHDLSRDHILSELQPA